MSQKLGGHLPLYKYKRVWQYISEDHYTVLLRKGLTKNMFSQRKFPEIELGLKTKRSFNFDWSYASWTVIAN